MFIYIFGKNNIYAWPSCMEPITETKKTSDYFFHEMHMFYGT